MSEATKECPFCKAEIPYWVSKCRFCGEWVEGKKSLEEAIASIPGDLKNTSIDAPVPDEVIDEDTTIISYKTHDPTWLQKFLNVYWMLPQGWRLDEFSFDGKNITVSTRKGETLTAPIDELSYSYQINQYDWRESYLVHGDKKIHFREQPYMLSDEEWEQIHDILDTIPDAHEKGISKAVRVLESIRGILKGM